MTESARSRTLSVAPTETSAARSASPPPRFALTLAARALACAASRVSRVAVVRARRAVDRDGAVPRVERDAAVPLAERVVLRRGLELVPELLRAVPALLLRAL